VDETASALEPDGAEKGVETFDQKKESDHLPDGQKATLITGQKRSGTEGAIRPRSWKFSCGQANEKAQSEKDGEESLSGTRDGE